MRLFETTGTFFWKPLLRNIPILFWPCPLTPRKHHLFSCIIHPSWCCCTHGCMCDLHCTEHHRTSGTEGVVRSEWPNKRLVGQFPVAEIIDCWASEVIGGTDMKIKLSVDLTVGMWADGGSTAVLGPSILWCFVFGKVLNKIITIVCVWRATCGVE